MSEPVDICCSGPSRGLSLPEGFVDPFDPATDMTGPGGPTVETIENGDSGNRDWTPLEPTVGETVQVDPIRNGDSLSNWPPVRLSDADSVLVDMGAARNSQLIVAAADDETRDLAAGVWRDRGADMVTATAAETAALPPVPGPLDALDWAGATVPGADDGIITVYFAPPGVTLDGYTSEGFNDYEIAQFMAAFALYEAALDVTFVVTDDPDADLRLVLDTNEIGSGPRAFLGYFNPPGTAGAGIGVFNGATWDRTEGGSLEEGGFDFVTIVHELGHALGLAHPHDTGGGSEVFDGVSAPFDDYGNDDLNQGVYTTMSYNSGNPAGDKGARSGNWGYEAGPMALDIALLQEKYGANTTTGNGNTVYALPDENISGTYWLSIWDVDGVDTITYAGSRDTVIDLRPATLEYEAGGGGYISSADGVAGGYTIAAGVVIENAQSGSGADRLTGNDAANTLNGGAGDDIIVGGRGNDRLEGNRGRDDMSGGAGNDRYIVDSTGDVVTELAGQGHDTIESFVSYTLPDAVEVLRLLGSNDVNGTGGGSDDSLVGNTGDNVLTGRGGFDILTAKAGDDALIGGAGLDWLVGDEGADTFVYTTLTDSGVGQDERDLINGFDHGLDRIDLSALDADASTAGDQAFEFIGTAAFDGAGIGQVSYASWESLGVWNIVSIDADGDGEADMQIFVNLTDTMSASDFIL